MTRLDRSNPQKLIFSKHALSRFCERILKETAKIRLIATVIYGRTKGNELSKRALKCFKENIIRNEVLLEQVARAVLVRAKMIDLPPKVRIERFINNCFIEAIYYKFEDIRFVVTAHEQNGRHVVMTVEKMR